MNTPELDWIAALSAKDTGVARMELAWLRCVVQVVAAATDDETPLSAAELFELAGLRAKVRALLKGAP